MVAKYKNVWPFFPENRMSGGSLSDQWRNQGNAVYVTAKTDLPPSVRETRLQNAMNFFGRALDTAATDNEVASASKNIGVCSWRLASVTCMIGKKFDTATIGK